MILNMLLCGTESYNMPVRKHEVISGGGGGDGGPPSDPLPSRLPTHSSREGRGGEGGARGAGAGGGGVVSCE